MDDFQIISSEDNLREKKSSSKVFLVILILIFSSVGTAGFSYFLGTKVGTESPVTEISVSPTETLGLTPPSNIEISSPSATQKPSPTLNPPKTPSPTPSLLLKAKVLSSVSNLDGFATSDGGVKNNLEIRAGRNEDFVARGFISFNIEEIPSDSKIQSAILRLYQVKVIGNPYTSSGSLKIDHLTYGDTLDKLDYGMPALSTSFNTLSVSTSLGWKEVEVTQRVRDDISNARSTSQYRIHFQTETVGGTSTGDFAYFESRENTQDTGNTPQLIVKYY